MNQLNTYDVFALSCMSSTVESRGNQVSTSLTVMQIFRIQENWDKYSVACWYHFYDIWQIYQISLKTQ